MKLRGCFSLSENENGRVLEWVSDGRGGGRFTGLASFLANLYVEIMATITPNITYVEDTKLGTLINGTNYDGCLGRLQSGVSDFASVGAVVDAPNIKVGALLSSQTIGFFSTYDPVCSFEKQEVLYTVQNISPLVWIIVLLITLSTSLLMALGIITFTRTRNSATSLLLVFRTIVATFKLLFKLMIKQSADDAYGLRRVFFKFMMSMIILMAFYVSFFAAAIVKTDAVTVKRPATIESYDDILGSNVRLIFDLRYRDHISFQNAKPGTKKKRIWRKYLEMRGKNMNPFDFPEFHSGRSVLFANQLSQQSPPIFLMHHCMISRKMKASRRPLFRVDVSESESLTFMLHSGHMNKSLSEAFNNKYQIYFEAGQSEINVMLMDKAMSLSTGDRVCTDNRIVMPDAGFSPIRISQIRLLVYASNAASSFALLLFLCEKLIHLFMKKGRERPIRSKGTSIEEFAGPTGRQSNQPVVV